MFPGLGHMTKMAATPIYGKNLQKSPEPEPVTLWLGMWHWDRFLAAYLFICASVWVLFAIRCCLQVFAKIGDCCNYLIIITRIVAYHNVTLVVFVFLFYFISFYNISIGTHIFREQQEGMRSTTFLLLVQTYFYVFWASCCHRWAQTSEKENYFKLWNLIIYYFMTVGCVFNGFVSFANLIIMSSKKLVGMIFSIYCLQFYVGFVVLWLSSALPSVRSEVMAIVWFDNLITDWSTVMYFWG